MSNKTTIRKGQPLYTWKTTKNNDGYSYTVCELIPTEEITKHGHYVTTKIIKFGDGYRTRAIARSHGIAWKMYYTKLEEKQHKRQQQA